VTIRRTYPRGLMKKLLFKVSYPDPEKYPDPTQEPFDEMCIRFGIPPPEPGENPLAWAQKPFYPVGKAV